MAKKIKNKRRMVVETNFFDDMECLGRISGKWSEIDMSCSLNTVQLFILFICS